MQIARPHGSHDLGKHAGFEIIVQDMSAGKANAPGAGFRQFRMGRFEAVHVVRRIAGPALTADILIEPAIAIGADVKTGHFLFPQVNREGIHILLAESGDDHGVQEGFGSQIFGVPARARQRTRDGSWQYFSLSRFQHYAFSPDISLRLLM